MTCNNICAELCIVCREEIKFTFDYMPEDLCLCGKCFNSEEGERLLLEYKFKNSKDAGKVIDEKARQNKHILCEKVITKLDSSIVLELVVGGYSIKPSQDWIEHFSQKVFNSSSFLNALNDAIPKGENKIAPGLESMPYLLASLRRRKEFFERTSSRFFKLLSFAMLFFIFFSLFFSSVMLGQVLVGDEKLLNKIQRGAEALYFDMDGELHDLKSFVSGGLKFKFGDYYEDSGRSIVLNEISALVSSLKSYNDLDSAIIGLGGINLSQDDAFQKDVAFFRDAIVSKLRKIRLDSKAKIDAVNFFDKNLDVLEGEYQKNATAIAFKHFSIGLVTSAFFIYLIKILVSLYTNHLREKVAIENVEMDMRKFYIAYNSCLTQDQRLSVLTHFIGNCKHLKDAVQHSDTKKEADNNLSELFRLLTEMVSRK